MTAAVGVLCARVRVEEKQLLTALATAGAGAMPLPPTGAPLPIGPVPPTAPFGAPGGIVAQVVIDRCQDRAVAAAVLPVCRALGGLTLDAGLAATGDRLATATALAAAGIARPTTRLVCSEEAALAALDEAGYPATLLPLVAGSAPALLHDRDAAEAVLEHRAVLGSGHEALALIQGGAPAGAKLTVIVVGGRAVGLIEPAAVNGWARHQVEAIELAEAAAAALGASVIGVEIAVAAGEVVVWDTQAVPEFRAAAPLGRATVAEALAALAAGWLEAGGAPAPDPGRGRETEGARDDVVVTTNGHRELLWQRTGPAAVDRRRGVSDGVALSA